MSSSFPLFKLPILCIHLVLRITYIEDLLKFSRISKKCYKIVKSLKHEISGFRIALKFHAILIEYKGKNDKVLGLDYFARRGMVQSKSVSPTNENYIKAKTQMDYLIGLFGRPVTSIEICAYSFYHPHKVVRLGITKCDKLFISGNKGIRNEHLQYILNSIRFTNEIWLNFPMNSDFYYDPDHFQSKILVMGMRSPWLKMNILLNLKCSNIILAYPNLTPENCVEFIDRWLNSEDRTFEYILLLRTKNMGTLDTSRFKMKKWNEKQRGPCFQIVGDKVVDCSSGLDLQRKDGLWATLLVQEDNLFFCVWHKLFHDVTGRRVYEL